MPLRCGISFHASRRSIESVIHHIHPPDPKAHLHFGGKAALGQAVQPHCPQQLLGGVVGGLCHWLRVQGLELAAQALGLGGEPPVVEAVSRHSESGGFDRGSAYTDFCDMGPLLHEVAFAEGAGAAC